MTRPYYDHGGVTIFLGDCREVLPFLPAASVDLVLTDPPYNCGTAYASHDDRMPPEDYRALLRNVWAACARVCRDGLVYTPGRMNIFWMAEPLAGTGFAPRRALAWHRKEYAGDKFHGGPAVSWEPVLWASCAEKPFCRKRFGAGGRDYLVVPSVRNDPFYEHHPCPKPLVVTRWLAGLFLPDHGTLLDPFAGTGTTLRAAKDAGCKAVGVEIHEPYCELAARRLEQEVFAFTEEPPT